MVAKAGKGIEKMASIRSGRPKKSNDETCNERLSVRLSGVDMTNLKRICYTDKKTRAEFIRDCIKNRIYELDYNKIIVIFMKTITAIMTKKVKMRTRKSTIKMG